MNNNNQTKSLKFKHFNNEIVLGQPIYNEPYYLHMSETFLNSDRTVVNIPLNTECFTHPTPNMFEDKEILEKHGLVKPSTKKSLGLEVYHSEEVKKATEKLKELENLGVDTSPVLKDVPSSNKNIEFNTNIAPADNNIDLTSTSLTVNQLTSFTVNLVTYKYTPMDSDDVENRGKYFTESKTVTFSSDEDFFYKTNSEISVINQDNKVMSKLATEDEFVKQEKEIMEKFIKNNPSKIEIFGQNNLPIGNNENFLPGLVRPPEMHNLPVIGTVNTPVSTGNLKVEWLKDTGNN